MCWPRTIRKFHGPIPWSMMVCSMPGTSPWPPTSQHRRNSSPTIAPGGGDYDERNRPFLDFHREVVNGPRRGGAFVTDDRGSANIILGRGITPPPDSNIGQFHLDYREFWYIMEGQIDYLIERPALFSAGQGDVLCTKRTLTAGCLWQRRHGHESSHQWLSRRPA